MKKIVIPSAGGYGKLKLEEHPTPEPQPGEIRVDVCAAGVNFADVVIRQGLYESAKQYVGWPITPGFEFAGTVSAHGEGVNEPTIGSQVFGVTRFGGYASQVCVPARQLFSLPDGISFEQAAGIPAVFFTAFHALFQNIVVRPNMKVLVHSAAGGMGTALLQLLKILDCDVVGVVGASHKVEVAERFGAGAVIDKSREDLWARAKELAPEGYDIILDGNGPATLRQGYQHLRPVGKIVAYGFHSMFSRRGGFPNYAKLGWTYLRIPRFHPLDMVNQNRSVICFNLSFLFDRTDLLAEGAAKLTEWLSSGELVPLDVTTYPIEKCAVAHRALESAQTTGKLVLTM